MNAFYMHTISGKPAYYAPRQQIVFAFPGGVHRCTQPLCRSLKEIKNQQRASQEWRAKHKCERTLDYGYVRVHVPNDEETT